ncbi:MAG: ABC transporter substrate-binding protein [Deltaproteobacteria bacterium]|nr:MAG: ABC transporter substrate-binding protein [Deltaproteobacteria bacterium]
MRENSIIGPFARQHRLLLSTWLTIASCFYLPPVSAEPVVVSYPSRSLTSFLIPEIARQRGFFLAEGMGGIDIKALLTGDVDYVMASGSAVSAFVAGIPVRLVLGQVSRAEHVLMAQNKYRQVKDLKGQTIGSLNPGGLVDALLRQILSKNGLDPDRDVVLINLGGTPERYAALKSGTVAATVLGAPHNFRAERDGFRKIASAADYAQVPTSGLTVRSDRIVKQPQQIKKMIRGTLRAMRFMRENRGDTIATVIRELGMDSESATKGYEQIVSLMSEDGHVQAEGVQFLIDLARQSQRINKPLTAAQMIDHSLLEEVLAGK